jgi:hypothetical protein
MAAERQKWVKSLRLVANRKSNMKKNKINKKLAGKEIQQKVDAKRSFIVRKTINKITMRNP